MENSIGKVDKSFALRDVTNRNRHQQTGANNHHVQLRAANMEMMANHLGQQRVVENSPNESVRQFLQDCSYSMESFIMPQGPTWVKESSSWTEPIERYRDYFSNLTPMTNYVAQHRQQVINKNVATNNRKNVHLAKLVKKLQHVEQLSLVGRNKRTRFAYAELAKMRSLVRLDIHINSTSFAQFPNSIDPNQHNEHKLNELHISMTNINVTKQFGECFERFIHLTKLTVFIGKGVQNSQDLLLYFGRLAENAKLESLVLAGNIEGFRLDVNYFEIAGIQQVRICPNQICECTDHAKIS